MMSICIVSRCLEEATQSAIGCSRTARERVRVMLRLFVRERLANGCDDLAVNGFLGHS